jgi:hypothetical protein
MLLQFTDFYVVPPTVQLISDAGIVFLHVLLRYDENPAPDDVGCTIQ